MEKRGAGNGRGNIRASRKSSTNQNYARLEFVSEKLAAADRVDNLLKCDVRLGKCEWRALGGFGRHFGVCLYCCFFVVACYKGNVLRR